MPDWKHVCAEKGHMNAEDLAFVRSKMEVIWRLNGTVTREGDRLVSRRRLTGEQVGASLQVVCDRDCLDKLEATCTRALESERVFCAGHSADAKARAMEAMRRALEIAKLCGVGAMMDGMRVSLLRDGDRIGAYEFTCPECWAAAKQAVEDIFPLTGARSGLN